MASPTTLPHAIEAEQSVLGGPSGQSAVGSHDIRPLVDTTMARIRELAETGGGVTGLSSGYADLDAETVGLQPSDLIIVAGRPSMGKTALALNMAEQAVLRGVPTIVFSLEMNAHSLGMRLFSSMTRIDLQRVRSGKLNADERGEINAAADRVRKAPIRIEATPSLTPGEVRSRARRFSREHAGVGLIVVDYLQLMNDTTRQHENRASEISAISRSLKALAMEMACPVVALSQLNRALETRSNKRPVMVDLRESGAIEDDADLILFIYRDELYNEHTDARGMAEIIIGKQRNGPTGTVKLAFLDNLARFDSLAPGEQRF